MLIGRLCHPASRRAFIHSLVAPLITVEIVNHRRSVEAVLIEKRKRIALQQDRTRVRSNFEFVMRTLFDAG